MRRFRLTSPVPLESDVQRAAKDAFERHPAVSRVFRVNSGARKVEAFVDEQGKQHKGRFFRFHDVEGMSDLWLWLKPRYGPRQAFVEIKRRGEEPTTEQETFMNLAREHGHIAFWIDDAADAWKRLSDELKQGDSNGAI